jgi:hypothetical protein
MSVILCSVFLAALLSRILVSRKEAPGFDVYGHLCFADALRAQRRGPFGDVTLRVVGATGYSQPFMWHWLIGFFDAKALLRNQAWLNGVIDSLFVVIAFLIAQRSGYSDRVALCAVAIYLLTPMWFSTIAIGPRIAGFTPRLSSEVATNLFFMVCLLPIGLSELQIVILGSVLAAFVLSSSKFGVQALLFLTPLISLISGSLLPLVSLVVGLTLTIVVSRGRTIDRFRSQVMHLVWYCRENLKGRMHVSNRNSFGALFKRSEPTLKSYLVKLVHRVVSENSYTAVSIKLPVIFLVTFAILQSIARGGTVYASDLAAPIMAACLVYFVVNLRPFLFLGEAERYLNHVAFFIALFAAKYALDNRLEWLLWALLVYGIGYWGIEVFALEKLKPAKFRQRAIEDDRVLEDLQALTHPTVVLCYPYQAAGGLFRIILKTPHKVIYCMLTGKEFSEGFNARYAGDYPYVKLEKLDGMADEYGVRYVVLDRLALKARGFENWTPSFSWVKRPVGGEIYDVYYRPT